MPKTQIILPARLASTRLPEKLLQRVGGKSILQHTYDATLRSNTASDPDCQGVVVAVDDQRLADEVERFGGRWLMTPKDCASGTDRIAIVAEQFPDTDVFINVQSDEPEIEAASIDAVARLIISDPAADIATAATAIRDADSLTDPSIVKIVMSGSVAVSATEQGRAGQGGTEPSWQGTAIYFSRACVPHQRDGSAKTQLNPSDGSPPIYWHHLGLYAYRREFLAWFAAAPPSVLEQTEKLEQLRAIEAGKRIVVASVPKATPGIDTPADLESFRKRIT